MAPVLASLLILCLFVFYLILLPEPEKETEQADGSTGQVFEPAREVRDVTPENVLKAPEVDSDFLERLPAVEPPPPPPRPVEPLQLQRPEVVTAGTLKIGGKTIKLAGIDAVPLDKKCWTNAKVEWPCGMFARTDLRRFVRGRPVECDPVDHDDSLIETRCRLAGYDISAWLVMTGWAEPAGNLFSDELAEAQEKERGIWRKSAP